MNVYEYDESLHFMRGSAKRSAVRFNQSGMPILSRDDVLRWMNYALAGLWSLSYPLEARVCFNHRLHIIVVSRDKHPVGKNGRPAHEFVWGGTDGGLSDFACPQDYRDEFNTIAWWADFFTRTLLAEQRRINKENDAAQAAAAQASARCKRFVHYMTSE